MPTRIPRHFFERSVSHGAFYIGKAFAMWLVPSFLSFWIAHYLDQSHLLSSFALILPIIFLTFIAGNGMHGLALVGHEGTHFNLHPHRFTSAWLGIIVSSLLPFHMDLGFALHHAQHHRFGNRDGDPDKALFSKFSQPWSRFLLARLAATHKYALTTWGIALGASPEIDRLEIQLSKAEVQFLARVNLCSSAVATILHGVVAVMFPQIFLFFVGFPVVFAYLISSIRPYMEHGGLGEGRFENSRTWTSTTFDFFYGGINYHLAHHLYPSVPAHKLRELHFWLQKQGKYPPEGVPQITSWSEALQTLSSRFAYGSRD